MNILLCALHISFVSFVVQFYHKEHKGFTKNTEILLFRTCPNLSKDSDCPFGGYVGVNFLVDHQYGSESAGTDTRNRLNREEHIVGRVFLMGQFQFLVHCLQYRLGTPDMTGGSIAEFAHVFPFWGECKVGVKCCDSENVRRRQRQRGGNERQNFLRQIAVKVLYLLQNGNQPGGIALVGFNDFDDTVKFSRRIGHTRLSVLCWHFRRMVFRVPRPSVIILIPPEMSSRVNRQTGG